MAEALHCQGSGFRRTLGLGIGEPFVHESFIGSTFTGTVEEETTVGEYEAIIPGISGSAHITGLNTIYVDSNDPFPEGFAI